MGKNQLSNKLFCLLIDSYAFLLDLIFPKYCVGCFQEGVWLCEKCRKKIILVKEPVCPECNRLSKNGRFCSRCARKSFLKGVVAAAYYQEGPLKEAIHTFKYEGVFDLARELGSFLVPAISKNKISKNTILIPVPLHRKRLARRGFNQAGLLAREIKKIYPGYLLLAGKLIRTKQTEKTQVELSGAARRKNVQGIFSWNGVKNELEGKTVYLIDDIYTTGATLQECARILRTEAGAREVWGLVLAKA